MANKVFLSPSNQFNNKYAYGNTTEGVQCGKVAAALQTALKRCGFEVKLMHEENMDAKVPVADKWGADLYIPIHSNACNGKVSGTRMFCYSTASKGYTACKAIYKHLAPLTPGTSESISADPTLYETRMPDAPTAYIEIDFHDVASVAKWIVEHTNDIAEAICKGVCDYFGVKYVEPADQKPAVTAPTKTETKTNNTEVCKVELPILKKGVKSGYVRTLQVLLNRFNHAGLSEDGEFGNNTYNAVVKYQKDRKLDVDGIVGAQTWAQLLK